MPEAVADNAQWLYDYVPEYNLEPEIIEAYLRTIWGNYKFFVTVSDLFYQKRLGGTDIWIVTAFRPLRR